MKIILASASPRRREILSQASVEFTVIPSVKDEVADTGLAPGEYARTLAEFKAKDVASLNRGIVLGADTIVVLNGRVLGKPKDEADARRTLLDLSGRVHDVITGYAVIYGTNCKKMRSGYVTTKVFFNKLSDELIDEYIATGSCYDKAGSYGIQDGFPLVDHIEGSLTNVIGLPIEEILNVLKEIENEEH